jgi:hypothetical protein
VIGQQDRAEHEHLVLPVGERARHVLRHRDVQGLVAHLAESGVALAGRGEHAAFEQRAARFARLDALHERAVREQRVGERHRGPAAHEHAFAVQERGGQRLSPSVSRR